MKDIFSTHDVARICSVTPMTVIRWIEDGRLPASRTAGGHRRVQRSDLDAFCRLRGIAFDPQNTGKKRILVAIVDPEEREAIAAAARGFSAEVLVEVASDGIEAGRLIASSRPQLLIVDERAPGADVRDVAARLKTDASVGPLEIVIFGPPPEGDLARTLRSHGVSACLRRPCDPVALRSAIRAALGMDVEQPSRRARVLVVDDDPLLLRAVRRDLERRGLEVIVCEKGYDALLLVGSVKPDLVLLDIHLPDIDGIEVARRVRARPETAGVELVAITGSLDERVRRKLLQAGAREVLTKPFTADEVIALLPQREASALAT